MPRSALLALLGLLVIPLAGCVTSAGTVSGGRLTPHPFDPTKPPREIFVEGVRFESQLVLGNHTQLTGWNGFATYVGSAVLQTVARDHYTYGADSLLSRMEDYCKARGFSWDAEPAANIEHIAENYTDVHKLAFPGSTAVNPFQSVTIRVCHDLIGGRGVDFIIYSARYDLAYVATGRDGFGNVQGYGGVERSYVELHDIPEMWRPADLHQALSGIGCQFNPRCIEGMEIRPGADLRPHSLGAAYAWGRLMGLPNCKIEGRLNGALARATGGGIETMAAPSTAGQAVWSCFGERGRVLEKIEASAAFQRLMQ
jgi:hypothetical protein